MLSRGMRWFLAGILVFSIVLTVVLVVLLTSSGNDVEIVVVETPSGLIQGQKASDGDYDIFLGIPYAQVNASNHFGASIPYPEFNDTFIADDDSAQCPQMSDGSPVGNVDCLRLNIYVPHTATSNNRLPVMVWIHGGSFETGFFSKDNYGPKFLVRHDVILITINYRLGVYGFLCLDIPEVPGNQGLKDQVLALRWIRDNIEAFGGDSNNITPFGVSAGGHSIDFHIISETEPFFKKAILQSGSSLASTVFNEHVKTAPLDVASFLGYDTNSVHEAISFLSATDSKYIVQAWKELDLEAKPCTEMKFDNVESFLTRPWVNADAPKAKDMTIITGFNAHELLTSYFKPEEFAKNLNVISDNLNKTFAFDEERFMAMEKNIRNFYFGDGEINQDMIWPAIFFDSDYKYIHPIQRSIKKYLENDAKSVFYYMFSYNGTRNQGKFKQNITAGTAAHGDDLGYLFDMKRFPEKPSVEDQLIIDQVTTMWTNFAKYSDPTPNPTSLLPVRWPSITNGSYYYLSIDSDVVVGRRPLHDRMSFWDLFYIYNEKYQKEYVPSSKSNFHNKAK